MFCTKCGAEMVDNDTRCPNCDPVPETAAPAAETAVPVQESPQPKKPCPKCGAQVNAAALTCTNCGFQFIAPQGGNASNGSQGMAVASLILSIVSFFTCGLTGIIGIILGFVAKNKEKNSIATAGIVTGFISIGLNLLIIILSMIIAFAGAAATYGYYY